MGECRDDFRPLTRILVAFAILLIAGFITFSAKMGGIRESANRLTVGGLVKDELEARGYDVKHVDVEHTYNEEGFTGGLHMYTFTVTYKDGGVATWYYMSYEDINDENVKEIYIEIID